MLEERSLRLDLAALGLLALGLLLGLALLTYDPADPPGDLVYPPREIVDNVCGRTGAWLAHLLFSLLGLGAYYLLGSTVAAAAALLVRKHVSEPGLRLAGWLVSLAGVSTLAALALPGWSPGPVIGAGGYLGAACGALVENHFARAGSYVLLLSLTACGLLLSTDYVLVKLSAALVRAPARGMGHGLSRAQALVQRRLEERAAKKPALRTAPAAAAGKDQDKEPANEPTIRIRGRQIDVASTAAAEKAAADESEDELDTESNADEATDEPTEAETPAAPAAADDEAIRIRTPQDRKAAAREELMQSLAGADRVDEGLADYELPSLDLLLESEEYSFDEHEKDIRKKARILEKTFRNFGFEVRVVEIETGPVIAQFEVELEAGLRLSKITSLADDLAIALRVPSVRIVAPIPGKNTVGIEVPNQERQLVRLREVVEETTLVTAKQRIPIFLGKDVAGKPMVVDLTTLPHLLIAGRTGTGKSVCLNTIIMSILMTRRPDEVKMLLIDPKMVELTPYTKLPHLMHPVVTDMKKAEAILAWAVDKMEERYALLARAGVRHISVYNQLGEDELMDRLQPVDDEERKSIPLTLPFIVIVADEMADLMMTAPKEVESHIIRLAQKSRAVGIHLVLATQKPTVDVITGLIKSNLPARIAFQVASRTDSRVVLDEMGADKLLGNGDLLFLWPGTSTLLRGQGAYVSDDEINRVCASVATTEPQFVHELVHLPAAGAAAAPGGMANAQRDELYLQAVELVVNEGRGSVSLLQRGLGIGYGRAARLIDYMAEDGIVGQYAGSQAREVLLTPEAWRERQEQGAANAAGGTKPVRPSRTAAPPSSSAFEEDATTARGRVPWQKPQAKGSGSSKRRGPVTMADNEADEEPAAPRTQRSSGSDDGTSAPWENQEYPADQDPLDDEPDGDEIDTLDDDDADGAELTDGAEEDAFDEDDDQEGDEIGDELDDDESAELEEEVADDDESSDQDDAEPDDASTAAARRRQLRRRRA